MAKETTAQIIETGSLSPHSHPSESQNTHEHRDSIRTEEAQALPEAGVKGILQVAIRKVMQEIEHHENEARRHLQQAAELRKELRESIAFLHEQGEKGQRIALTKNTRSDKAASQPTQNKTTASSIAGSNRARARRK